MYRDIVPRELSAEQLEAVRLPRDGHATLALVGPPGSGKTAALIARLQALIREGRRPYEMLILAPQRAQVERMTAALAQLDAPTRGGADMVTYYGLARRALSLYWPLVAGRAGFDPSREPTFCTIEAAQYHMWQVAADKIERQGYFSELKIRRERLLSQLIDNLNKAAVVGFDHSDVFRRLRLAWTGGPDQASIYWQAQDCAIAFREHCLANNLVDFSLTIETYARHLMPDPVYARYFAARYRHLLVDNLEENVPVAHDLIARTLPQFDSALLTLDEGGGHRVFLGADAAGARGIADLCQRKIAFTARHGSPDVRLFGHKMSAALSGTHRADEGPSLSRRTVEHQRETYWIGMCRWVVDRIVDLLDEGVSAGEIAILAPYVSEVMRFSLEERLAEEEIPLYVLRPSAPLYQDPVIRAMATLALMAYPDAADRVVAVAPVDVALALRIALVDLDPVRAQRLAEAVAPALQHGLELPDPHMPPAQVKRLWDSVGYEVRERYATLCEWLATWRSSEPQTLEAFWPRLFGDILSRPGYGMYQQLDRVRSYGRLIESTNKFTAAVGQGLDPGDLVGEYLALVMDGIAAAEYEADRPLADCGDQVLLAPAYAYLTRDLRTDVQIWMDLSSDGWWNRPNQPLTNPYVLSRQWPEGQPWTDIDEERAKRSALARVIEGLTARCGQRLILASSSYGLDGTEQVGRMERAIVQVWSRGGGHGD